MFPPGLAAGGDCSIYTVLDMLVGGVELDTVAFSGVLAALLLVVALNGRDAYVDQGPIQIYMS